MALLDYAANTRLAFTEILRKEFAKVDDFYLAQYERLHARLTHTPQDSCSAHPVDSFRAGAVVSYDDLQLEEHIGTLLELLDHLEKLLWFGYVNYIASQRILDKFDRFTTSHRASGPGKLLFGAAFAQQDRCLSDIREVESALNHLVGLKVVIPVTSYLEDVPDRHHSLSKASEKPLSDLAVHLARKKRVEQVLYKRHQADQLGITLPVVDDALIKYLKKADDFGRVPLHYAAEAGLLGLCRLYLEALNESDQAYASSVLVTEDDVGNTPTHLSIVDGHVEVTEYLAEALRTRTATRQPEGKVISSIFGSLLHLAARAGHTRIVQILVSSGADINHRGAHEETVLHVAARNGNVELVRCMQNLTAFRGLVDLQESNWGRTALMSACIGGDQAVVELLLRAGSDPDIMDARGYTAKDHAAFQGHLGLLKHLLVNHSPRKTRKCSASDKTGYPKTVPNELSWSSRRRNGPNISSEQIHVRLGASNTRSNAKMVELKLPRWLGDDEMRQGAGFALEISLSPAPQLNHIIHLPPLEDLTNHPIIFETTDPRGAQIMFKIVRLRSFTGGTPEVIGSGVAILSSLRERLAPKHESLVRDHTIPIIAKDTLSVLGSVTFNFLIITPFTHVEAPLVATHGFWRDDRRTEVVGHRGSGANTASKTSLQIGENTIQSFMSAVASGASCIEFDVQLTKDLVPVIFHDFLVMETGGDVPLHTLTSAQFLNLSRLQSRQGPWSTSNQKNYRSVLGTEGSRPRSLSEDQYGASADGEIGRRMRYTEEGIRNDIKGNLRGLSIQEPSTTLEELLTNIPESIAFNLEISK